MRLFVYIFPVLIIAFGMTSGSSLKSETKNPGLHNLNYNNPELQKLRKEIALNLKASARGHGLVIPLRVVNYKVMPKENFYFIMARLSQDADTLSSINELSNPGALQAGQILKIPNARGVFKSQDELKKEGSKIKFDYPYQVGDMYFFPGEKMPIEQRRMFRAEGFVDPLGKQISRVSSGFGLRRDPFRNIKTFHGGLDIAAKTGSSVYASRSGHIKRAEHNVSGYGTLVVISHGYGYETWYGHLDRHNVKTGQKIRAGQKLGEVGASGLATGPHLHFEIRKNGHKKNPVSLLHR